jgi:hypothetical protein
MKYHLSNPDLRNMLHVSQQDLSVHEVSLPSWHGKHMQRGRSPQNPGLNDMVHVSKRCSSKDRYLYTSIKHSCPCPHCTASIAAQTIQLSNSNLSSDVIQVIQPGSTGPGKSEDLYVDETSLLARHSKGYWGSNTNS